MAKKYTGQCACHAVRFEFDTDPGFIAVCHCLDCKRASGGEAATWFGVPAEDFTVLAGEPKPYPYSQTQVASWIGNFARTVARACSPATWTTFRVKYSFNLAASTTRIDYAEAGDVREATPSLGEAAGPARILRHASLTELTPL